MTNQGLFQGSKHGQALLAQRREIAPDTAESLSTRSRTETARNLLLHLDHA
jgi:hypothetical protein